MASPQNIEKLSGTVASGGMTAIAAFPTLTEAHDVPGGETHEIWLYVSNNHGSSTLECLGNFGPDSDAFNFEVLPQSTLPVLEGAVLVGPATMDFGAVSGATNMHFTGKAIVHKYG